MRNYWSDKVEGEYEEEEKKKFNQSEGLVNYNRKGIKP